MSGYIVPAVIGVIVYGPRLIHSFLSGDPKKSDDHADSVHTEEQRAFLTKKVQELALKAQIPPPKKIGGKKNQNISVMHKVFSPAYEINIAPSIMEDHTKGEIEFVLAHEIAHVKNNDATNTYVLQLISFIGLLAIAQYFSSSDFLKNKKCVFAEDSSFLSSIAKTSVGSFGTVLFTLLHKRYFQEPDADQVGFSLCSKMGQQGAISLMKKNIKRSLDCRNSPDCSFLSRIFRKLVITPSGNVLIDIEHPFLTHRLKKLELLAGYSLV